MYVLSGLIQEDSTRPFIVSSPTNGKESEKEGWVAHDPYDPQNGDTHYYNYTRDCWNWNEFPRTRFASEFGFQSWPSLSTLSKVTNTLLKLQNTHSHRGYVMSYVLYFRFL